MNGKVDESEYDIVSKKALFCLKRKGSFEEVVEVNRSPFLIGKLQTLFVSARQMTALVRRPGSRQRSPPERHENQFAVQNLDFNTRIIRSKMIGCRHCLLIFDQTGSKPLILVKDLSTYG